MKVDNARASAHLDLNGSYTNAREGGDMKVTWSDKLSNIRMSVSMRGVVYKLSDSDGVQKFNDKDAFGVVRTVAVCKVSRKEGNVLAKVCLKFGENILSFGKLINYFLEAHYEVICCI